MSLARPTDLGSVVPALNAIIDQLERQARGEQPIVTNPKVLGNWIEQSGVTLGKLATSYADAPPGYIVASASFTAPVTASGVSTEAAAVNVVTSSSFTADGVRKVLVSFFAPDWNNGAVGVNQGRLSLYDGSSAKGQISGNTFSVQGNLSGPVVAATTYLPAAGSTTLSIRLWSSGGGTVTVDAGAGGAGTLLPGIITVAVI